MLPRPPERARWRLFAKLVEDCDLCDFVLVPEWDGAAWARALRTENGYVIEDAVAWLIIQIRYTAEDERFPDCKSKIRSRASCMSVVSGTLSVENKDAKYPAQRPLAPPSDSIFVIIC